MSCEIFNLAEVASARASERPGDTAFVFLGRDEARTDLTYGELDVRARRLAHVLTERHHLAADETVAIALPPGLDYVVALFGCMYAGVVAVPVYPPDQLRRASSSAALRRMIEDARAALVLVSDVDASSASPAVSYGATVRACVSMRAAEHAEPIATPPRRAGNPVAYLQYTSGSTGVPRGVVVSHDNLVANLEMFRQRAGYRRDAVKVSWLPPFHDAGLVDGILQPVYSGCLGVLLSPLHFMASPFDWLKAMSTYKGTHGGAPNFAFELCCRKVSEEERATLDLSSVEVLYNAAEPVRATTIERFSRTFAPCGFRRDAFMPCYGLAEATLIVTGGRAPRVLAVDAEDLGRGRARVVPAGEPASREFVSCGPPVPPQELAIVGEAGAAVGPFEVGEIWVRGPNVARAYHGRVEETEATFGAKLDGVSGTHLRTGDLGFVDDRGELFVTGRSKDMLIVRGAKIYPQDIERAAEESHPAVRAGCSAAFSVEVDGEERIVLLGEFERRHRPDRRATGAPAGATPSAPPSARSPLQRGGDRRSLDPEVDAFSEPVLPKPPPLVPDDVVTSVRRAVAEQCGVLLAGVVLVRAGTIQKTSSGKIMRRASRDAYVRGELEVVVAWTADAEDAVASGARPVAGRPANLATSVEIRAWLTGWCARRFGISADVVDARHTFASYGLDSPAAVALAQDLTTWLGRRIPPTVVYDFPNVEKLSAALVEAETSRKAPAAVRRATRRRHDVSRLVQLVESMSDEAVAAALAGGSKR